MKKLWLWLLSPGMRTTPWLIALGVLLLLGLGFAGYLAPLIDYLDSDLLAFHIGKTRLSAFLVLKGAIALVVLVWITNMLNGFVERRIRKLRRLRPSNRSLLSKTFQIITYVIAFLIGLNILGIDVTALAVFSGAIGIGVGFGLQKIASNFITGLILLSEKTIEVDDLIELPDGIVGFIRYIGARHTRIETPDGKEIMIPNEDFITSRVVNWTYSTKKARVEILLGVAYGSDIVKAQQLILEAAQEHPRCSKDPIPTCFLAGFGDSAVNFQLFFWVDDITEGRFEPKSDVLFAIWHKFKEHGIDIPFPQRDLRITEPVRVSLQK